MKVLLTGGTGFIGLNLLNQLVVEGHEVVLLVRNTQKALLAFKQFGIPERAIQDFSIFEWTSWDAKLPGAVFDGVDAVVHLLGESIGKGRWTEERKKQIRDSRIVSTQNLLKACPVGLKHFICASAVGIYAPQPAPGVRDDEWLAEKDFFGEEKVSFLEELCREWERAAQGFEIKEARVVRLRIGLVLGNSGFLSELLPLFRWGLGGPIGDGAQMLPWIHIEDLTRAVMWILENQNISGPVNIVGPNPVSFRTFGAVLAKILGRPFLLRIPPLALKLALGEKSVLPLASCPALPQKLMKSGFSFKYTMCSRALKSIILKGGGR